MEPISWSAIATSVFGGLASKALMGGDKGGEQQQAAPAQPEQAPQTQSAKSAGAATMMQQNADTESGPGMAGSTLLTSNDLGAGTLGKSKTLGG
jgi:hypothetical protein